ncbi:MAG: segregation/condensation protein A, partial [Candidatus Nanopelagicales bacterium]|nr:segregation/condensation protein A [Candidatus Nanopelagicales bacterium]
AAPAAPESFSVRVGDFEGPFDLLLTLISKHKLEVTELALHTVTDEFISYIRAQGKSWDLDETSSFLVVAATLLDLKAARLLPSGEVDDEEDLALLEARDLLFARLLQYRAYKEVSSIFADRMAHANKRFPRTVGLEPQFAALLPEVLLGLGPDQFAALAARALAPKPIEEVSTAHAHVQRVNVREQAMIIVDRLRRHRTSTFRALIADCDTTLLVVGRFLALLELYREAVIAFEQITPLGDLTIRWTGDDASEIEVTDEFDVEREVDAQAALTAAEGPDATDMTEDEDAMKESTDG